MQSVYQDAQNQYGITVYYLPMDDYTKADVDSIWGELKSRNYTKVYGMRMLADDQALLGGQGDLFSKFGLDIVDEIILWTTRREFVERRTGVETKTLGTEEYNVDEHVDDKRVTDVGAIQPKINDLLWIPMWHSLFEISYVEDNENLNFGHRAFWKLIAKKYIVSPEENVDLTESGSENLDNDVSNDQDIIDVINAIDDNEKAKIAEASNIDLTETGMGDGGLDNIINDDSEYDANASGGPELHDKSTSDGDIFSNF